MQPRWMCTALPSNMPIYDAQVKASDASSPRWGLAGFYARVLRGGFIRPKDIIELLDLSRLTTHAKPA